MKWFPLLFVACSLDPSPPDARSAPEGEFVDSTRGVPVTCEPHSFELFYDLGSYEITTWWGEIYAGSALTFPRVRILFCDLDNGGAVPIAPGSDPFPRTERCIIVENTMIDSNGIANFPCGSMNIFTDVFGNQSAQINLWRTVRVLIEH